jgi:hypothetical protein
MFLMIVFAACCRPAPTFAEIRSYDGSGNNVMHFDWGAAGTALPRMAGAAYDDGISSPRGFISNTVVKQTVMMPNTHQMTDWVFQWGQFVDHDLDLTVTATPAENFPIPIPVGDPIFSGTMSFQRSKYDPLTGLGTGNPREQINEITSYLVSRTGPAGRPIRRSSISPETSAPTSRSA